MPYVEVWVDDATNLKECDEDDLVKEMKRRGFTVFKRPDGADRVEHLLDCALLPAAREEALLLVEELLERPASLARP